MLCYVYDMLCLWYVMLCYVNGMVWYGMYVCVRLCFIFGDKGREIERERERARGRSKVLWSWWNSVPGCWFHLKAKRKRRPRRPKMKNLLSLKRVTMQKTRLRLKSQRRNHETWKALSISHPLDSLTILAFPCLASSPECQTFLLVPSCLWWGGRSIWTRVAWHAAAGT